MTLRRNGAVLEAIPSDRQGNEAVVDGIGSWRDGAVRDMDAELCRQDENKWATTHKPWLIGPPGGKAMYVTVKTEGGVVRRVCFGVWVLQGIRGKWRSVCRGSRYNGWQIVGARHEQPANEGPPLVLSKAVGWSKISTSTGSRSARTHLRIHPSTHSRTHALTLLAAPWTKQTA